MQQRKDPRGILVVGLIQSLKELVGHNDVVSSLQQLCALYQHQNPDNDDTNTSMKNKSWVHVHIIYQQADVADTSHLQLYLQQAGKCHRVDLISETDLFRRSEHGTKYWSQRFPTMNRFERLAALRSLQRQQILNLMSSPNVNVNLDNTVILNVDADILQFPPLTAMVQAIDTVATIAAPSSQSSDHHDGAIVCANGYERWTLPILGTFFFYYDTFASIDHAGVWYYREHVQAWWRIFTLSQATLFHDIIMSHSSSPAASLWPMQSCFGGLAVYDFGTWANAKCDYNRNNILLHVDANANNGEPWMLSPRYTVNGTLSGDACEHVVFQQCLLAASQQQQQQQQQQQHSNSRLMIGVQPSLLIGRQADTSMLLFVLRILALATVALSILAILARGRRISREIKHHRSL